MDVHISGDLEELVQNKLRSGHYQSADEMIREALQALDVRDRQLDAQATEFKNEIGRRLASEPPTPMDFAEIKAAIRDGIEGRKARR